MGNTGKPQSFGDLLRRYRKDRRLTQIRTKFKLDELNCPYSISALSMWETGKRLPDNPEIIAYLGIVYCLSHEQETALLESYIAELVIRKHKLYIDAKKKLP